MDVIHKLLETSPELAALVFMFFLWMQNKKGKDDLHLLTKRVETIVDLVDDLHDWHDVTDPQTGAKIWYHQKTLEHSVERLAEAIEHQTTIMQKLFDEIRETRRDVQSLQP